MNEIIREFPWSLVINIANQSGQTEPGYRVVFTLAALFLVVAAFCILFVREGQGEERVV